MKLFTIGFTKKSAEEFFTLLIESEVRRVVDVRLNNTSQLAGFAKSRDLEFLLRATGSIEYAHMPLFAPTQELLDGLKKHKGDWAEYEREFAKLVQDRDMPHVASSVLRDRDCLLCSEHEADHCHRRLVAESLGRIKNDLDIVHL